LSQVIFRIPVFVFVSEDCRTLHKSWSDIQNVCSVALGSIFTCYPLAVVTIQSTSAATLSLCATLCITARGQTSLTLRSFPAQTNLQVSVMCPTHCPCKAAGALQRWSLVLLEPKAECNVNDAALSRITDTSEYDGHDVHRHAYGLE